MYIFKNALKSITRSKGRNILIGIILTVIAISSCIALSIRNSANDLVANYKDSYNIIATLTLDRKNLQNQFRNQDKNVEFGTAQNFMNSIPQINVNMIKTYGESEYVDNYYYSMQTNLSSDNIKKVSSNSNVTIVQTLPNNGGKMSNKAFGDFRLVGYSSEAAMSEFISGTYKITDGEMFKFDSNENTCIISDELAEENNLQVGSDITLKNPNNSEETYTLKVVGIYTDSSANNQEFSMFSLAANQILTNYNVVNNIVENSKSVEDSVLSGSLTSEFKLKNPDIIDDFEAQVKEKGLDENYAVSTNIDNFNESIKPIENISSFATILLVIILCVGGVILTILNMINIRERKYEIGVLRAIGMKKNKVLGQFLIELLIVTMIAIIIGTAIGSILSVPTASSMLKNEIDSQNQAQNEVNQNFGRGMQGQRINGGLTTAGGRTGGIISTIGSGNNVNYVDQINAIININVILQLVLIGIGLTILSGSISMIFISRYTPLKILSSRT